MGRTQSYLEAIFAFSKSTRFFIITCTILVANSLWLALTAIYPLPFDEYYHFGLTKLYALQWSPFFTSQPLEASIYGDITRDPSYIYHYIMSFPYRLIDLFTDNQTALVIGLRLINIALVVGALILFRKLFLKWKVSPSITNLVILMFVLTPIVPFLAAHINYDNLLLLLTAAFLIVATRLIKAEKNLARNILLFFTIGMLTVLVKHAFLPVFAITTIYTAVVVLRKHRSKILAALKTSVVETPKTFGLAALIGLFIVLGGLWVERYGVNFMRYNTITPRCEQIQPISVCEKFMPWARNRDSKLKEPTDEWYGNPVSFSQHWASKMTRGYFAIFSHTPTQVVSDREPFGPIVLKDLLPLPIVLASSAVVVGLVFLVLQFRRLWKNQWLRFSLVLCAGYLMVLWAFNYRTYLSLGAAHAIQARYTYPILLLLFLILAMAYNYQLTNKRLKVILATTIVVLYAWSGGVLGWLIRADETWYWQNQTTIHINQRVQTILRDTVPH